MGNFENLALVAFGRRLWTAFQVFKGSWVEIALKFWEAEKDLNNRIQVARISKVLHACVAGTEDGYKDFTFFEDFRKSQTKIGFKVQFGY